MRHLYHNHSPSFRRGLIVSLVCLLPLSALAEVRTWTDDQGRQMQAEFVRLHGATVYFVKSSGEFAFPLRKLSPRDQAAVVRLAVAQMRNRASGARDTFAGVGGGSVAADGRAAREAPPNSSSAEADDALRDRRTWADKLGNTVTGSFVRMHDGNVIVRHGTKVTPVPFYNLSEADQGFVRDHLASLGQVNLIPPRPAKDGPGIDGPGVDGPGMSRPSGMGRPGMGRPGMGRSGGTLAGSPRPFMGGLPGAPENPADPMGSMESGEMERMRVQMEREMAEQMEQHRLAMESPQNTQMAGTTLTPLGTESGTPGMKTPGMETPGMDPLGMPMAGKNTDGMNSSNPSGMNSHTNGIDTAAMEAPGTDSSRFFSSFSSSSPPSSPTNRRSRASSRTSSLANESLRSELSFKRYECSHCKRDFDEATIKGKTHCPECGVPWENQGGIIGTKYNNRRPADYWLVLIAKVVAGLLVCAGVGVGGSRYRR